MKKILIFASIFSLLLTGCSSKEINKQSANKKTKNQTAYTVDNLHFNSSLKFDENGVYSSENGEISVSYQTYEALKNSDKTIKNFDTFVDSIDKSVLELEKQFKKDGYKDATVVGKYKTIRKSKSAVVEIKNTGENPFNQSYYYLPTKDGIIFIIALASENKIDTSKLNEILNSIYVK
ncbi:MAG: hypothetical protein ACK5NF_05870 [Bacilli bacterium]